jgi:hypothetical protein
MLKYYHEKVDRDASLKHMAAWFPIDRKWPEDYLSEDIPLRVYFMNECLQEWQCAVDSEDIMNFLEGSWSKCFTIGDKDSPIRVLFEGTLPYVDYHMLPYVDYYSE